MSELYFRLGKIEGFTASSLADKKEGYAIPIRELLQNSLDASREADNTKCEINIHIETIPKSKIPHIVDYENTLKKAIETHTKGNSFNDNAQRTVDIIQKACNQENITVLMFSDNGTGMPPKQINAIFDECSIKGDEMSGGSYGVGHLSSYWLSSLRYVLYATKYQDNGDTKTLFTGSPILAGHRDEHNSDRGSSGRIVAEVPKSEKAPEFIYPDKFPDFIQPQMNNLDRGTMVIILGLSEEWSEDAEYAIAGNFFYAISYEELNINIHQNGRQKEISYDEVERLIEGRKEEQRKKGENILSGKAVYQAWQAVVKGHVANSNDQEIKIIKLKNFDKVHVFIKNDSNTNSTVVLVRNGMVIARHDSMLSRDIDQLRKDPSFQPFTAVIDVDQEDAPKLFTLVKGAESPYHNKLLRNRLGKNEENKLKNLFKELSEKIKIHLKIIERDSFDFLLFPLPNKAEAQTNGNNKSGGQDKKAKEQPPSPKPPKPKDPKKGNDEKRPQPVVISRNLESKSAAQYKDNGGKWEVRLRVIPKNQGDARDDVYLSMCLGEDNDSEKTKLYLEFVTVEINGQSIKISDNKNQVKLGPLNKEEQYNIVAKVKKPEDEIGNMKVALLPILGLKQRQDTKV